MLNEKYMCNFPKKEYVVEDWFCHSYIGCPIESFKGYEILEEDDLVVKVQNYLIPKCAIKVVEYDS